MEKIVKLWFIDEFYLLTLYLSDEKNCQLALFKNKKKQDRENSRDKEKGIHKMNKEIY